MDEWHNQMKEIYWHDKRIIVIKDLFKSESQRDDVKTYSGEDILDGINNRYEICVSSDDNDEQYCNIQASGGKTGISDHSVLFDQDQMGVCCGNMIFCLSLPDLELRWKKKVDEVTCFRIFHLNNDYLVHGELTISRIDRNGHTKWEFSGKDIFVSMDGKDEITIYPDTIELVDFNNEQYVIDYNGKISH